MLQRNNRNDVTWRSRFPCDRVGMADAMRLGMTIQSPVAIARANVGAVLRPAAPSPAEHEAEVLRYLAAGVTLERARVAADMRRLAQLTSGGCAAVLLAYAADLER